MILGEKKGYYSVSRGYELGFSYDRLRWNPSLDLLLKKIRHPIPMYAKRIVGNPPATNAPAGFELQMGDWVKPYGNGLSTDVIFLRRLEMRSKHDYDEKLTVRFPNKGDGIIEFSVPGEDRYCDLLSPHEAPLQGYQAEIVREKHNHPGEFMRLDYDPNRNYFIRVRTIVDSEGHLKSALYGKIYGDFMQFVYYLNPTPNDQNIEFDPSQNLLPKQDIKHP